MDDYNAGIHSMDGYLWESSDGWVGTLILKGIDRLQNNLLIGIGVNRKRSGIGALELHLIHRVSDLTKLGVVDGV